MKKIKKTKCDTWFSVPSLLNYILQIENPKIFLKSVKTKFLRFWNPYIQDKPYPDKNDKISLIKNKTIYKIISLLSYGSILFLSLFFRKNDTCSPLHPFANQKKKILREI